MIARLLMLFTYPFCRAIWWASETFGFRCPFAPWVFGVLIGATPHKLSKMPEVRR